MKFTTLDGSVFKPNRGFYIVPNEYKSKDAIEQLSREGIEAFTGVIGGVDVALNYLVGLKPKKTLLIDLNPQAVEYSRARIQAILDSDTFEESLERLQTENSLDRIVSQEDLLRDIPHFKRRVVNRIRGFQDESDYKWSEHYNELRKYLSETDVEIEEGDVITKALEIRRKQGDVSTALYLSNILQWPKNWERRWQIDEAYKGHPKTLLIMDSKRKGNVVIKN